MNTFVSYEGLPVNSGGAHGLGKKSAREAYNQTSRFLKLYTDSSFPQHISLTLYKSDSFDFRKIKWKLMKKYGFFPQRNVWDFGDARQKLWTWTLTSNKIEEGLKVLEEYATLPEHEYGPITLSILWHFKFVDPETKQRISGQELIPIFDERIHNSRALLTLKNSSKLAVWFAFPFDGEDKWFTSYIKDLVKYLPFKPSDKHWRQWRKSSNGNWKPSKVEINTQ